MKKTLIALTVAALPMAAAQADSSNVTIYGQMNVSLDHVRTNGASPADGSLTRVSSNSSRIGFKGTEDLGNGMAANFQIESGLTVDGATGTWGSRNTYAGLSGKSWGEVRLGNHDTPYKLGTASLDIFADTAGDYNTIIGNVQGTVVFDQRATNALAYISPTMSGFHAAIAYVAAAEANNNATANPSAWSATGIYANGPIFASLSYEKYTNGANAAASAADVKGTKFGFGYNFGDAKVGFIYERLSDSVSGSETTRNAYGLNVAYTMGSNVLKAAYLKANDGDNSTTDSSAKNFTIGVDHNMSKRTAVYALYTKTTNASGAAYGVGGAQGGNFTTLNDGEDPSILSFGMKHSF